MKDGKEKSVAEIVGKWVSYLLSFMGALSPLLNLVGEGFMKWVTETPRIREKIAEFVKKLIEEYDKATNYLLLNGESFEVVDYRIGRGRINDADMRSVMVPDKEHSATMMGKTVVVISERRLAPIANELSLNEAGFCGALMKYCSDTTNVTLQPFNVIEMSFVVGSLVTNPNLFDPLTNGVKTFFVVFDIGPKGFVSVMYCRGSSVVIQGPFHYYGSVMDYIRAQRQASPAVFFAVMSPKSIPDAGFGLNLALIVRENGEVI